MTENNSNEELDTEPHVEKYIVAYVDILGYKDYLKKHPQSANEFLKKIKGTVEKFKEKAEQMGYNRAQKIEIKIFSDNFIMCKKLEILEGPFYESLAMIEFINELADFQLMILWEYKLLTRGAITVGELYIDSDFVFGPALIEAYELESKIAKCPRIIISDESIIEIKKLIPYHPYSTTIDPDYIFPTDADGKRYLNYFRVEDSKPYLNFEEFSNGPSEGFIQLTVYIKDMRPVIKELVDNFNTDTQYYSVEDNKHIIKKYKWLISKYNEACEVINREDLKINYHISNLLGIEFIKID